MSYLIKSNLRTLEKCANIPKNKPALYKSDTASITCYALVESKTKEEKKGLLSIISSEAGRIIGTYDSRSCLESAYSKESKNNNLSGIIIRVTRDLETDTYHLTYNAIDPSKDFLMNSLDGKRYELPHEAKRILDGSFDTFNQREEEIKLSPLRRDVARGILNDISELEDQMKNITGGGFVNGSVLSIDYIHPTISLDQTYPLDDERGCLQGYFKPIKKILQWILIHGKISKYETINHDGVPITRFPNYIAPFIK